jgi:hypothetical protein
LEQCCGDPSFIRYLDASVDAVGSYRKSPS